MPLHAEKYTLLIVAELEWCDSWRISLSRQTDPVFAFSLEPGLPRRYRAADAFEVQKQFLAVNSPEAALHFFERFGPLEVRPDKGTQSKRRANRANSIRWSRLLQVREELEGALLNNTVPSHVYGFVFDRPLMIQLPFRGARAKRVYRDGTAGAANEDDAAITDCYDVVDALRASIFLGRRRGFQWKRCARQGCNQLFEQDTRHQKIYCTDRCAHLQAVNNYNAKRKKPKKQSSTEMKKGK
jgi:hypothetical protein